ncbi:hypothetical protein D4764_06G0014000 [Takifugu flavidus]|uniref:Uncharacterized protein n=1 Tax=Takifugu flavidus TaxID=433684 RepID=A0A5C6N2I2_9TELE|nr:hypothetical protein D4764_06G0014000 [Takifugu flavidus]
MAPEEGLDGPYQGTFHPILPENPSQDAPGDPVISLFQVHKAHVDWLGKLPTPLKHPSKGKELIRGSTTGAKPVLFLLNQSIIPVPKTPHPEELSSYRPVALTSHLMKTLERLILAHLRPLVGSYMDPL